MKQEDKELLIKDLCARLPYNIKLLHIPTNVTIDLQIISNDVIEGDIHDLIENFKPYLFPLSSMTEEQKEELNKKYLVSIIGSSITLRYHSEGYWDTDNECEFIDYYWLTNWFYKNHFDYTCLIEKGLAIDATNLNIY